VLITGDFFVAPARVVLDLESTLRGSEVALLGQTIERFFATHRMGTLSVSPEDFRRSLEIALAQDASDVIAPRGVSLS